MKLRFRFWSLPVVIMVVIGACKKNDIQPTAVSDFQYKYLNYSTNLGFYSVNPISLSDDTTSMKYEINIELTNVNSTGYFSNYKNGNFVELFVRSSNQDIPLGNYTHIQSDSTLGYNAHTNFYNSGIGYGLKYQDSITGKRVPFITGNLTVEKLNNIYTITYTGKDSIENAIAGKFTGALIKR